MKALTIRIIRQITNDRRSLALMMVAPLLIMTLMWLILGGSKPETEQLFNSISYVFIGIISFFFTFMIAGVSMVHEKFSQTLERMLITPIRRWQIVGGYMLGYGVLSVLQGVIIMLFAVYVLGIPVAGSVAWCIAIMVLMAFLAVGTGALISTISNSEFQVVQFIPLLIIPQVFFTGLFSLDEMPYHLGNLCYAMPIYYGCAPLKKVMLEGAGIEQIYGWLLCLVAFIAVLFIANVFTLKKYRKL